MTTTAASSQLTSVGAGRRWLFTGMMLLIPVLFFVLLEGGLRLGGYGDDYPLFVPVEEHHGYLVQNREVARRYFAQQASVPNSIGDFFRAEKTDRVFRIFVQGGSSAAGYPFYHGGAFSRMLQQRLQQTFPERDIEVVNTAMAAVNSYTLLDFADEIIAHRPDLVLIYAGHNEYYGALGVGSAESLGQFRGVVNAALTLRRFRTVQLLRNLLAKGAGLFAGRGAGEQPSSTLMARMVGEQTIPYGSAVYERGLDQFRGNLSDLLAKYDAAGIPVFVGTLASNERDRPPFVNIHVEGRDEAEEDAQVRAGMQALERGELHTALMTFNELTEFDSLAANAYFGLGRAEEVSGNMDAARAAYLAAKDRDGLRFRAPEAFNRIIRETAVAHGATVVEVQDAIRRRAPHGIIGHEHMLEHLHPTLDGYFLIADAFYDALQENGVIGDWSGAVAEDEARSERLVTPVDSTVGMLRVKRLTSEWPFQPRGTVNRGLDTLTLRTPVDSVAWALYRGETTWLEATDRLNAYYVDRGDLHGALMTQFAVIQEYPLLAAPYGMAGNLLMKAGRPAEAEAYYQAALDRDSTATYALGMLGALRLRAGNRDEAIRLLERAIRSDPANTQALYNLSGAYATSGRYADARRTTETLLRLQPDHADARRLLASLPQSSP